MSVNGISSVSGVSSIARIATSTMTDAASATAARANTSATNESAVKTEEADAKPVTVHFPWLSRLSVKLEAASNKRATFPTQILGDNLDQKA